MKGARARFGVIAVFSAACVALPAPAIEIESDLSTHYVEIRTNFQGADITVFGGVFGRAESAIGQAEPIDLIVVVRGPPREVEIRRKARTGLIWANTESLTARRVPSFYSIASTRPLTQIADVPSLQRYEVGYDQLRIEFDTGRKLAIPPSNPPAGSQNDHLEMPIAEPLAVAATGADVDLGGFRQALVRHLGARHTFRMDGSLTFIRANLFRAEIDIPATVPPGQYGAEVYIVQRKTIVGAEHMVFSIDKKGLEGDIYGLAYDTPLIYGIIAVLIAVGAGWASEFLFRRR
ncbi:MAG: TIGR02186 family protein [Alphaproteobacteria bacterium]